METIVMRLELNEIARRLELNLDTLMRWIRQGRIPVKNIGDVGIFNEPDLKRWAKSQRLVYRDESSSEQEKEDKPGQTLSESMRRGGCFRESGLFTKNEILRYLVDKVPGLSQEAADELFVQLLEREKLTSTGIGKGVAIPHPRNPLTQGPGEPVIVTCFLDQPIDFNSIDDRPVSVLFLLLSPGIEVHLSLLSRLSFCLRDAAFVEFLNRKPSAEEFLDKVEATELTIDKKGF